MSESEQAPTLESKKETPEQAALFKWYSEQRLKSVDTLDAVGRQIITLCTTLLGVLLGLMALTENPVPAHMNWSGIQWLGGLGVVALLAALGCALGVIYPRPYKGAPNVPKELEQALTTLLKTKNTYLSWSVWLFAIGMSALGLLVILTLTHVV